jgi:lysophospholipase L1-like esterase
MMKLKVSLALVPAAMLALVISCKPLEKLIHAPENLRWEEQIQAIESLNAVEFSNENTLLVTGSSSVRIWDSIHADLAPYQVMQRGYGGARLSDYNLYAERIIKPQQFKAIVVFVGNDIHGGENDRTPREMFQLYQSLVEKIRSRNPLTPVFWIETTPTPRRWHVNPQARKANSLIRDWSEESEDLHFISTFDAYMTPELLPDSAYFRKDMLHLNRSGYKQWAEIILGSLEEAGIEP